MGHPFSSDWVSLLIKTVECQVIGIVSPRSAKLRVIESGAHNCNHIISMSE